MTASYVQVPPDSTGKQVATNELAGKQYQIINLADSTGAEIQPLTDAQLRAAPVTVLIDSVDNVPLGTQLNSGDVGLVTNTVIHGQTTAGGGSYVDVKVTPSGALSVEVGDSALPAGAATEATLAAIDSYFKAEDTPAADGDKGMPMLAMRYAADTPTTGADGDYTIMKLDEEGRLKVASKPASYADITGDITAVQATIGTPVAGGTVAGDVSRASNVMMFCTGTFSTVNCTFEGSIESTGDTNWFAVQAVRSNANTIETTTGNLSAQPAYAWELSVNGLKRVRVRCTARTSGTQSWRFVLGTYATEPIPAAQVSATQGVALTATTVRAGFVAASGIWYDDSSTALAANATFTGTSRDLTVTATATAWANAATYAQELRLSAESDVTGTLWLEVSRDNTNWRRVKSVATTAVTGGGFYAEIVHRPSWRYTRVGYTNGATLQARFTINSVLVAV